MAQPTTVLGRITSEAEAKRLADMAVVAGNRLSLAIDHEGLDDDALANFYHEILVIKDGIKHMEEAK